MVLCCRWLKAIGLYSLLLVDLGGGFVLLMADLIMFYDTLVEDCLNPFETWS